MLNRTKDQIYQIVDVQSQSIKRDMHDYYLKLSGLINEKENVLGDVLSKKITDLIKIQAEQKTILDTMLSQQCELIDEIKKNTIAKEPLKKGRKKKI